MKIPLLWDLFVHPQGLRPSSADPYHDQMQQQEITEEHLKLHHQDMSRKNEMKEQVNKIFSRVAQSCFLTLLDNSVLYVRFFFFFPWKH